MKARNILKKKKKVSPNTHLGLGTTHLVYSVSPKAHMTQLRDPTKMQFLFQWNRRFSWDLASVTGGQGTPMLMVHEPHLLWVRRIQATRHVLFHRPENRLREVTWVIRVPQAHSGCVRPEPSSPHSQPRALHCDCTASRAEQCCSWCWWGLEKMKPFWFTLLFYHGTFK